MQADTTVTAAFPWSDNPDRTIEHVFWWVNSELMKNTAEIVQLKRIQSATGQDQ